VLKCGTDCFYGRLFEDLGLGDLLNETGISSGWLNSDRSREEDALNVSVLYWFVSVILHDHFLLGWCLLHGGNNTKVWLFSNYEHFTIYGMQNTIVLAMNHP